MKATLALTVVLWWCLAAAPATGPSIDQKTRALRDQWKSKFDAEGLHYVVAPPFLIAGDGSPRQQSSGLYVTLIIILLDSKYWQRQYFGGGRK